MNNLLKQTEGKVVAAIDKYVAPEMAHYVNTKVKEIFKEALKEQELTIYYAGGGCEEDLPLDTRRRISA